MHRYLGRRRAVRRDSRSPLELDIRRLPWLCVYQSNQVAGAGAVDSAGAGAAGSPVEAGGSAEVTGAAVAGDAAAGSAAGAAAASAAAGAGGSIFIMENQSPPWPRTRRSSSLLTSLATLPLVMGSLRKKLLRVATSICARHLPSMACCGCSEQLGEFGSLRRGYGDERGRCIRATRLSEHFGHVQKVVDAEPFDRVVDAPREKTEAQRLHARHELLAAADLLLKIGDHRLQAVVVELEERLAGHLFEILAVLRAWGGGARGGEAKASGPPPSASGHTRP